MTRRSPSEFLTDIRRLSPVDKLKLGVLALVVLPVLGLIAYLLAESVRDLWRYGAPYQRWAFTGALALLIATIMHQRRTSMTGFHGAAYWLAFILFVLSGVGQSTDY